MTFTISLYLPMCYLSFLLRYGAISVGLQALMRGFLCQFAARFCLLTALFVCLWQYVPTVVQGKIQSSNLVLMNDVQSWILQLPDVSHLVYVFCIDLNRPYLPKAVVFTLFIKILTEKQVKLGNFSVVLQFQTLINSYNNVFIWTI